MRNELRIGIGAFTAILAIGCSDPADNVPAASVSSSSTNAVAPSQSSDIRYYTFGTNNSSISFVGSKVTGSHDGGFRNFSGQIAVQGDKIANAGTKVTIDTTSLWSDNDRLTGHLKNADFFDVEKFPTSTFETTSVAQQGTNATVSGNLTLHGITKQITFPAAVSVSPDSVTVLADFSINRFDFEMKYPGKADDLIRDKVVIKLDLKASPSK